MNTCANKGKTKSQMALARQGLKQIGVEVQKNVQCNKVDYIKNNRLTSSVLKFQQNSRPFRSPRQK